jgi:hypothetical protein
VAEAGLCNVTFTQSDVCELSSDKPFDAVVGRFILQFLPDPVATLRALSQLVQGGRVIAFHEPCWTAILPLGAHLPLWSACASLVCESLQRSGGDSEMGLALCRIFQQAGLPTPNLQMERWRFRLQRMLAPRSGSTSFFVLCCRKSGDSVVLSKN